MISPQRYQPDRCENTGPDLETMRHHGLMVTGVLSYGLYFQYSMKSFKSKQKCEDAPESRSHVGFVQHSLHLPQKMYNCPCSHLESPRFTELLCKVQEWRQSQPLPLSSLLWEQAFGSILWLSSEVCLTVPLECLAMHLHFLRSWCDSVRLWTWHRREDGHTHSSPSSRSLPNQAVQHWGIVAQS